MSRRRVQAAFTLSLAGEALDGVELGPAGTPVAFRIWQAGPNVTDYGTHVFTERSAAALMAEQAKRGNLYSIDVDHLSLKPDAPPEARKAVGWARLDTRPSPEGPELWAVDVEWTDVVAAGLAKRPPEWRYFSPAYDVTEATGEIVSFLNIALTNNPATHSVTALAARRIAANTGNAMKMSYEQALAALLGDDEEKRSAAKECIAAWAKAAADAESGGGEGDDKDDKEATRASEGDDEKPKAKDEEATRATAASRTAAGSSDGEAALLARVGEQDKRLAELEKSNEEGRRKELLASRPDLTEGQRSYLASKPLRDVEALLASPLLGKPADGGTANAARVTATRGETQASREEARGAIRASRSQSAEQIAERFGRPSKPAKIHWEGTSLVLERITREEARRVLAAHGHAPEPTVADLRTELIRSEIMTAARAAKGVAVQ